MLSWSIEKDVISELRVNGENIILPWGFETADSSSFFSLEQGIGWRYKVDRSNVHHDESTYQADITTAMKEGRWRLLVDDQLHSRSVTRKVEAETLESSLFMDFVMRFRFKKECVEFVEINGARHLHKNTNVYYQYSANNVDLQCNGYKIRISIVDAIIPPKMEPVIYVRDYKDEWVVHVRMFPKYWDKEVIKICTAWAGTRPLPQLISKCLLRSQAIRNALWYRGERRPFQSRLVRRLLNPAAFGMVKVSKGQRLMWNVKMEIV